jgi:hypothetical protein
MPLAFRQFLMTNFLSAEFILAFWRANLKISAKCRVQGAVFNAEIFRQCKKHCPPEIAVSPFANRHSLLAAVLPFATRRSPFAAFLPVASRYSPFAAVFFPTCRFADLTICLKPGSAGVSPSRLIPSCVPLSDKLDGS